MTSYLHQGFKHSQALAILCRAHDFTHSQPHHVNISRAEEALRLHRPFPGHPPFFPLLEGVDFPLSELSSKTRRSVGPSSRRGSILQTGLLSACSLGCFGEGLASWGAGEGWVGSAGFGNRA